ncbi:hypothetical protein [Kaistia sp. MMO-174]|uniref:hypothetical protein n=1 Tax=Kaistia sp. MMO-174 TaxID=3081256 RepID=UPI0030184788
MTSEVKLEPTAEEIELKPCPFCGERLVHSPDLSTRSSMIFVHPETEDYCVAERVMISTAGSGRRVVAWNTRAAILAMDRRASPPAPAVAVGDFAPDPADADLIERLDAKDWRGVHSTLFRLTQSQAGRLRAMLAAAPQPPATRSYEEGLTADILAELVRARAKFPGKNVTLAALMEEVGELATATFEEGRERVRKEAVQVAVMAMRMVLDGDHTFDAWRAEKGLDALVADREPAP